MTDKPHDPNSVPTSDQSAEQVSENLKFTSRGTQTVEAPGETAEREDMPETADMEGDFEGLDPNMFAQVQDMMAKMEKADELEKENAELKGRLGRLAADFESYRRRTQEDVQAAEGRGVSKAAQTLMPVYDDLDRALSAASSDPAKLIPGVQSVQASVLRLFTQLGLESTGKVGEAFDPQWHEALQVTPGEDGKILQVYQLGFRMGDQLVRPARVVVGQQG